MQKIVIDTNVFEDVEDEVDLEIGGRFYKI